MATPRWRTNELVVCAFYRALGRPFLHNLAGNTTFAVTSPVVVELLSYATRPRTEDELTGFVERTASSTREAAERLLHFCMERELLCPEECAEPALAALELWRRHGWSAAAVYHFFTRDFPFLDYSRPDAYAADQGLMRDYKGKWSEPGRFKEYPGRPVLSLEISDDDLADVSLHMLQVGTLAKPTPVPLDRSRLAALLYFTFGQTGAIRYPIVEPLLRRTSPSGGARHPTEGYVAVLQPLDDVPVGLYHYSPKEQGLVELVRGEFGERVLSALETVSEREQFEPRAVIFYASMVERNMWRYREPRTYRVIHLDLGHLTWTSYLAATGLGIRTFAHHGMREDTIETLLGLDPIRESIYWYMALA